MQYWLFHWLIFICVLSDCCFGVWKRKKKKGKNIIFKCLVLLHRKGIKKKQNKKKNILLLLNHFVDVIEFCFFFYLKSTRSWKGVCMFSNKEQTDHLKCQLLCKSNHLNLTCLSLVHLQSVCVCMCDRALRDIIAYYTLSFAWLIRFQHESTRLVLNQLFFSMSCQTVSLIDGI